MNTITIAHLSDIHYNPGDTSQVSALLEKNGVFVEQNLAQCLKTLSERKPDILAVTGDLTHEGGADSYRYLREQFETNLPGVPILCSMGNHDVRSAFREGFLREEPSNGPYAASMAVKGFRFVSLDSAYEKGLEGVLSASLLDYLEEQLVKPAACGVILLLHHPVMAAAKGMSLTMTERFADILKSGKITAILAGHVHGSYAGTVYGVPQFTADSLKTGCDLNGDTLSYNDRAGYQLITYDKKGDWLVERFLLSPKANVFFTKPF